MVKFYLDKKGKQECEVFLDLSIQGKRVRMFTGKKINPDQWDTDRCRANPRKYKNNILGFNGYLQEIEDQIISLRNENGIVTKQHIKVILDKLQDKSKGTSFFTFANEYLKTQLEKGAIKRPTYNNHQVTLGYLEKHFATIDFNSVDLQFYDQFVAFLRKKGLGKNTIGRHVKSIKWFMRAGFDRGHHTSLDYTKSTFKTLRGPSDAVYLTPEELAKLQQTDLPGHLRPIADSFIINCNLGLRYGDQIHIQKKNIRSNDDGTFLEYVQGKTGALIFAPIPKQALKLLEKYDYELPLIKKGKLMSGQKFNKYIKEACELAKIDSFVTLRSCERINEGPKYLFVKSHTARRSFATNTTGLGAPLESVMAVTGHTKEQTFRLYLKSTQLDRAKSLARFYQEKEKEETSILKVEEVFVN